MSGAISWESTGAATEHRLTTEVNEARVFWRLRSKMLQSMAQVALSRSRVQLVSIAGASIVLWLGLFCFFFEGFQFIHHGLTHEGLRTQLIHAVFNVFFLTLTVMLFFSAAIILFGALYRSDEAAFLLSTPVRRGRIVLYKFQETVFFSCWGFVLLGSPMLLAYGIVAGSPWYYYVLLAPFVLAFVMVPAGLGAIACLAAVRLVPKVRVHALAVLVALVLAGGAGFGWRVLAYQNRDMMTSSWFQDVLARLEFSEQRLLPSWWLSSGLLEAAHPVTSEDGRDSWLDSFMFLAVLSSNALLLQLILVTVGDRVLGASYSGLVGSQRTNRKAGISRLDRSVLWLCRPFPTVVRHFIVKDLRLFRRDPVQWSQFAIFFGLLAFYFFNVRRFDYAGVMEKWVTIMSFLNLAVVGLILSTFTTRFIFPMISLEGRRFWILGTAPIDRGSILWGKFWFACAGSLPPCAVLVLLSDLTLQIPSRSWGIVLIHQLTSAALCSGLSALAVGLGACLPNLREPSPSKIAAGFGGTLNLVLSSLYIIVVVSASAIPCVYWSQAHWFRGVAPRQPSLLGELVGFGSWGSVVLGVIVTLCLGAITTLVPLRIGFRAFRRIEF